MPRPNRSEHHRQLRALLCDDVSLVSAWTLIQRRHATARATIEAMCESVKERGVEALTDPNNQDRLRRCDAAAIAEINRRIVETHKGCRMKYSELNPRLAAALKVAKEGSEARALQDPEPKMVPRSFPSTATTSTPTNSKPLSVQLQDARHSMAVA